jgi:hypothetical protein
LRARNGEGRPESGLEGEAGVRSSGMRKQRLLLFVAGPAILSACALIADLGERTLGDPNAIGPDAGTPDTASRTDDSKVPDVVEPPPPPSFCEGIVLYASFDGKLTGDVGGESTLSQGGVTLSTQGKFGGALSLLRDASTAETLAEGAALYFLATDAGNPWPEELGSLSIWYRVTGSPPIPTLYRPVATLPPAGLQTAGLAFYLRNDVGDVFGLHERSGSQQSAVFVFPVSEGAPYLRQGEFNHYFTAWRKAADAGPTAYIALNGGLGVRFDGDAAAPDAPSSSDGGELPVPYRGFTSRPWVSEGPPVALRVGGRGTNTPEGLVDDLVVWNRVLSFDEAAAVYTAGKAVGEVCKLR